MANWMTIIYKVDGDKQQLQEVKGVIEETMSMTVPVEKSDFGVRWIGCMVKALGGDPEKVYCRGSVIECGMTDGVLTVMVDIAESVYCEELFKFLQQRMPNCKVYYLEDDNCDTRYSNDKDWKYFSVFYSQESVRIV